MKRREFITLFGGAAAAWPVASRAQQSERMRRIGVLLPAAADDAEYQAWVGAVLQGLALLGWTIGRNLRIDTRWATANADNIRRHAAELVALAKAEPGKLSYGHAGVGTSQHLGAELFKYRAHVDIAAVAYRGSTELVPDLIANRINMSFANIVNVMPLAREGKLRALAITSIKRSPLAPDLPTMEEAGFADFAMEGWYGIFAPARTPRPIVDKLSADINKALKEPDSMERWKSLGFDPIGSTPEAFAERQKADLAYWKRMIDYTGIKVE